MKDELVTSPVIALSLHSSLRPAQATILDDHLLLPTGLDIKFPVIPPCDKYSTPNLSHLPGCMPDSHYTFLSLARRLGERICSARLEAKRCGDRTWFTARYGAHKGCAG